MILYYAPVLGGRGGASQSAVDVLVDLCATGHPLCVVSEDRIDLPDEVGGYPLTHPRWIHMSRPLPRPSLRKPNFVWRGPAWALKRLRGRGTQNGLHADLRRADPRLIVYNSFSDPDSLHPLRLTSPPNSAFIVRASPECFRYYEQVDQRRSLKWALQQMGQFRNLVFVSSRCRDEWLRFPELQDKHAFYIPNCSREEVVAKCHSSDRGEVRRGLGIGDDDFAMVCVASVQPRKGQDLLVEAFPRMLQITPNLKLFLVGSDRRGWAKDLFARVRGMGLEGRIHFRGYRSDALEHIYGADALVLPARSEAMPRTVLEAMTMGTPVLASAVAGVPELIEDEKSGFLFRSDDVPDLVDAFGRMMADPHRRSRCAARARDVYWARFSRARQIERYREAAGEMLEEAEAH